MKPWTLIPILLLAACASTSVAPPQQPGLLSDERFDPPSVRIERADIFALSPAMHEYLQTEIAAQVRDKGLHMGFFDAIYTKGQLRLDYDTVRTRNAAEAFADRSGNCLSLVIMSAAFAKALGMPVWYQSVNVEQAWSRVGDIQFFIGHVNLMLGKKQAEIGLGRASQELTTIDFLPPQQLRGLPSRVISEDTVVAMYMNNQAAEAFTRGKLDDAYWWARAAIKADPTFLSSYNTLGIVYRRHGDLDQARVALAYAAELEPDNPRVLANLVTVLNQSGRSLEASTVARRLEKIEPNPPFSYFNLGMKAFQAKDYPLARDLFRKEVAREPDYHEFHYWLGVTYANLGEVGQARAQLGLALENSTTRKDFELYSGKLDKLKKAGVH